MSIRSPKRPAWVEIYLPHLAHNIRQIQRHIAPNVKVLAVVKANAYGHGALQVAKQALQHGACMLGVATLQEGIDLRQNGITAPILILGAIDNQEAEELVKFSLTPTIFNLSLAKAIHLIACKNNCIVQYHLRIDTAGGSLGVAANEAFSLFFQMKELSGLLLTGIYTHLYAAYGEDEKLVCQQICCFERVIDEIKTSADAPVLVHASSTPAIINWPEAHYDMVRAGNLLYGLQPEIYDKKQSNTLCRAAVKDFKQVMELKARLVDVKTISPGELWLYGDQQFINKEMRIAMVPMGYADGFPLAYLNNSTILIGGKKVPLVGKVLMDSFMVDVTEIENVKIGDEVVIWGKQAGETATVDEIALRSRVKMIGKDGSIKLDTRLSRVSFCLLSERLPRLYLTDEK